MARGGWKQRCTPPDASRLDQSVCSSATYQCFIDTDTAVSWYLSTQKTVACIRKGGAEQQDAMQGDKSNVRRGRVFAQQVLVLLLLAETVAFIPQYHAGNLLLLAQWMAGRPVVAGRLLPRVGSPSASESGPRVGTKWGPWRIPDSSGSPRRLPSPGRPTVVIALGGCSTCSLKDVVHWASVIPACPQADWYCLAPDARKWESQYPAAVREAMVFLTSKDMSYHRRLGASFVPRVFVAGADGTLLYLQPPGTSQEAAVSAVRELLTMSTEPRVASP